MKEIEIISCSTFHDPEFSLKEDFEIAIPLIKKIFKESTVCITPSSNKIIVEELEKHNFQVSIGPKMERLDTYRNSIKMGSELIKNQDSELLFYVDFDRLIHWINHHPQELSDLKDEIKKNDYLHIGRTERAFKTHPETQVKTERIVNELSSNVMGLNDSLDIISVCYFITKELADAIVNQKMVTDMGFYSAWPVLLWNWTLPQKRSYIEAEGLEWETPDRFKKQIKEKGYENWMTQFKSPSEWELRVSLMHQCLKELLNISILSFKK